MYTEWSNGAHTCVDFGLPAPLSGDCYVAMSQQGWDKGKCGKKLLIEYKGKVFRAQMSDKCMGCKPNDLDLSESAFKRLTGESTGRFPVKWKWE